MRRNTLNFVVDLLTALVLLGMVGTGLILRFVLPAGSGTRSLWSLGRHDWGDVHFWLSAAIGALLVVHLALHWHWVCATTWRLVRRTREEPAVYSAPRRNLAGAGLVLVLAGLFGGLVWAGRANVSPPTGRGGGGGGGRGAAHAVEGSGGPPAPRAPAGRAGEYDRETQDHDDDLRGSMTLAEVSAASGVPVETLRRELRLPADTPADERLGRLSKRHGFSMQQARETIHAASARR